jgi:hypothetical protein
MIHNPIIYNNTDWVRPADWLPIDHLVDYSSEKIAMLFAVYDDEMNKIAFTLRLGTTVDWGDGNITVVGAAGNYEHTYTYSDISDSTLCSRGYKQVIITMYPTNSSYHLTRLYCALPAGMYAGTTPRILDMKIHAPLMASFRTGVSNTQRWAMMEKFVWIGSTNSLTSFYMFYFCIRLQYLYMDDPKMSFFYESMLLNYQLNSYTGIQLISHFYYNFKIKEFIHNDTLTQTACNVMFVYCLNLEKVEMTIPNVTNANGMFSYCFNLREVILHECQSLSSVSNATMFSSTLSPGLTKVELHGLIMGTNLDNSSLSANALNNLFESLGTPATTQILYVRYCPGSLTCDTSIATAKNWTVITS